MHLPLLVLIVGSLGAPPARPALPSPACDSAVFRTPLGSATDTLVLTLRRADGSTARLPSPWAESTLEAVARHLALPRPIAMPVWIPLRSLALGTRWTAPDTIVPTLSNAVLAVVTAAGRLEEAPNLVASSLDGRADAALLRAVRAADSARALAPAPVDTGGPHEGLRVLVGLGIVRGDADRAAGPAGAEGGSVARPTDPVTTYPVELVRRDRLLLTTSPETASGPGPGPQYPKDALRREEEGRAVVTYVLDERGMPVAGTLVAVRYTGWTFARAALDFVPRARFTPGRVAGCAVPMLVGQPFEFRLEG